LADRRWINVTTIFPENLPDSVLSTHGGGVENRSPFFMLAIDPVLTGMFTGGRSLLSTGMMTPESGGILKKSKAQPG